MSDISPSPSTGLQRRQFLRGIGLGAVWAAAGMPLPAPARAAEAARMGQLRILETMPLNAEPDATDLIETWLTPAERLYIRTHGNVPQVDSTSFRLEIKGMVERSCTLSIEELRTLFPRERAFATLQCAGNRRAEMAALKPIEGTPWTTTAIGNAEWTGLRLRDLLEYAGAKAAAKHVWFTGLDAVDVKGDKISFGASIPIEKALEETTLLAYAMNGAALTAEHGFPLRTVVPGYIGARSVKWLSTIEVSDQPSPNHFMTKAYKLFPPEVDAKTVDWAKADPLYELPVNAAISLPAAGTAMSPGKLRVEGWAFASGGKGTQIRSVEVSADGGRSWQQARFLGADSPYCWRLWQASVEVTAETKEIVVRATDTAGQVQPEQPPWNFKGYHYNAWHHVPVTVA